ncbi:MAG TPA: hypothetical protein VG929_03595 [Actinomycetota bacterium]|nr:hypothetical protein [Actinomycetota bacterium]
MTTALCTTCSRTVFLSQGQPMECPVCSSPLVGTPDPDDEMQAAGYYLG